MVLLAHVEMLAKGGAGFVDVVIKAAQVAQQGEVADDLGEGRVAPGEWGVEEMTEVGERQKKKKKKANSARRPRVASSLSLSLSFWCSRVAKRRRRRRRKKRRRR